MNVQEFLAAVETDRLKGPKLCTCGRPLGPRFDGGDRHRNESGNEICEDCWWDEFGTELENFPIGGFSTHRFGAQ